jgi:GNAT superfamily N-acetyltransferase
MSAAATLKSATRGTLKRLFADYRINWIVASDSKPPTVRLDATQIRMLAEDDNAVLAASPTEKVRNTLSYRQAGLDGLALSNGNEIVSIAHFASTENYDFATIWPLDESEMALVDIATEQGARGKGYAPKLIAAATHYYLDQGRSRLIAFIWWSNTPSLRCFHKAGWTRVGLSIEVKTLHKWWALRLPWREIWK